MKKGALLLTCSCSSYVDEYSFLNEIKKAAKDAQKSLYLIQKHRLAEDHTLNPFHHELEYLKSLFLL